MLRHLTTLIAAVAIGMAFSVASGSTAPSLPSQSAGSSDSRDNDAVLNKIADLNKKAEELVKQKRFTQARSVYQNVLKQTEAQYGPDHPMLIQPLNNIVRVSCVGRQCFETIPELKRMLAIRQKAYGKDSRDVPVNLLLLGEAYEKEQKYDEALTYFQQAVESEKRRSGGNSSYAQSLARNINRVEREKSALSSSQMHQSAAVK
jgi:tetratricopeptide (TPR) repeat protein